MNEEIVENQEENENQDISVSIFSNEEIKFFNKMSLHDRTQLLFSILYLASRPVSEEDLKPLTDFQKAKNEINLTQLVKELNSELDSRSSPYTITWNKEQKLLSLTLKPQFIKDLSFSDYFFKIENISRDKYKVLSFITFKIYMEHSHCTVDELLKMKNTFSMDELKLAKILFDLEQENLIYQVKKGSSNDIFLTNQFFEIMGLPRDKFQLGPILRNELIKVIEGDSSEDIEENLNDESEDIVEPEDGTIHTESNEQIVESTDNEEQKSDTEISDEESTISDLLKELEGNK